MVSAFRGGARRFGPPLNTPLERGGKGRGEERGREGKEEEGR